MARDYSLIRKGGLDLLECYLGGQRECRICISSRRGGVSFDNDELNLSIGTGDEDENVYHNRNLVGKLLGCRGDEIAGLSQVHGNEILEVNKDNLKLFLNRKERADGMITSLKNQWLSISIGDCQPVAVFDSSRKILCMVHAGWGGTSLKIVEEALLMLKTGGSRTEDLYAMLGPCIGGGVYQVDQRVFDGFVPKWPQWEKFVSDRSEGHGFLDIHAANKSILREHGVNEEKIQEIDLCTYTHSSLFFSHRREGLPGGRMFAFGVING
jgi:YfiH family protein